MVLSFGDFMGRAFCTCMILWLRRTLVGSVLYATNCLNHDFNMIKLIILIKNTSIEQIRSIRKIRLKSRFQTKKATNRGPLLCLYKGAVIVS